MDLNNKKLLSVIFLATFLVGMFLFIDGLPSLKNAIFYKQNLRFSNTQEKDPEVYSTINQDAYFVGDPFGKGNEFPPPPKNLSYETKKEIKNLHKMIGLRTEEKNAEIFLDLNPLTMKIGPHFYADFVQSPKPRTRELFDLFIPEFHRLVFKYKDHFDRVRPSFLDPTLSTVVGVPGHSSYPSGHASQSFLVASIASELDPQNRESYLESAFRVAKNREIAGVHYESDSEAGRLLAEEYLKLLFKDQRFLNALELAKREW